VKSEIKFFPYLAIPDPPHRTWLLGGKSSEMNGSSRPRIAKDPKRTPKKVPLGCWRSLAANYASMFYHSNLGVSRSNGDDPKLNEERGREINEVSLGSLRTATYSKDSEFLLHQHYTALDLA
jgi:hypothetical protein